MYFPAEFCAAQSSAAQESNDDDIVECRKAALHGRQEFEPLIVNPYQDGNSNEFGKPFESGNFTDCMINWMSMCYTHFLFPGKGIHRDTTQQR